MSPLATPSSKPDFWQLQQGIINFWKQHHSFEKSIEQRSSDEAYRFYDGPPFITGTPHYGTLLSSILKDVVPRYHTMKGKRVERVWGRDCHGLPIEEKVQKKLGLNSSLDIEKIGIQTFIDECYRYTTSTSAERSSYVDNIGRRVDFDNSYKTMDNDYMESVMRVFKQLRDKGLIYKGKRVSMYSTKLETPISSFEVAMDDTYGEINDPAITVMFRIDSPISLDSQMVHIYDCLGSELIDQGYESIEELRKKYEVTDDGFVKNVRGFVRNSSGDILMVRDKRYNRWSVPGGKIDVGESQEQALHREIAEELGVAITRTQYAGARKTFMRGGKETNKWLAYYYYIDIQGDVINAEPNVNKEYHFVKIHKTDTTLGFTVQIGEDYITDEKIIIDEFPGLHTLFNVLPFMPKEVSVIEQSPCTVPDDIDEKEIYSMFFDQQRNCYTVVQKHTPPLYALARTTTPWTIPCNIALAVNQEKTYVQVRHEDKDFILAKARLEEVFKGKEYTIIREISGSDLVGLSYQAPFGYFQGKTGNPNDHKIYHADFITDTDGTGIGHEAPEFGEVDFQLAKQVGLTITEAMNNDGTYSEVMQDLSGHFYRDMNDEMIERLRQIGLLFAKSGITHRVAFCPRSGVPLVYKAQDSRFINIQTLKPRLLELNEQINRYPEHLKHGRFAKSMESAPDRCISRTRYRGTPMPVYTAPDGTMKVVGSRDELFELNKPFAQMTKFILIRHGRTDYNDQKLVDYHNKARLTDLGKQQAQDLLNKLKDHKVDVIYSSPFDRCMETIRPYAEVMGLTIHTDDRLREFDHGHLQDKTFACDSLQRSEQKIGDGNESIIDIHERVRNIIHELIAKHPGQTVLICTHQGIIQLAGKVVDEYDFNKAEQKAKRTIKNKTLQDHRPKMAYVVGRTMKNLDLHRPTIDEILIQDPETQQTLHRIPEVLDCWMESASMPYGQVHYPFENKQKFENSFPADFVVEYTGQIRARFYVMHVLGVALFDKPAFQNVLCTGVMAGNDGRKMSKSYGNYMDPRLAFEQYGGDAIRMAIMSTPVVYGGDMAVKDEIFIEAIKKTLLPLWNAYSFLVTYASIDQWTPSSLQKPTKSDHFLDQWMLAELDTLIVQIDTHISSYAIHRASEVLIDFLDILTNRYIRRSRRRFWSSDQSTDKTQAYETLYYVIVTVCQLSAPLLPFISEYLWKQLTAPVFGLDPDQIRQDSRSVHLCDFPIASSVALQDAQVSSMMTKVRSIVKAGLAWRARRLLRVRQPLASLTLSISLDQQYLDIIAEELNIKQLLIDESLTERVQSICKPNARLLGPKFGKQVQELIVQGKQGNFTNLIDGRIQIGDAVLEVGEFEIDYVSSDPQFDGEVADGLVLSFDATITPELELEGYARDLIRQIQDARKEADYDLADRIQLSLDESLGLKEQFGELICEETLSSFVGSLNSPDISKTLDLGGQIVGFGLKR